MIRRFFRLLSAFFVGLILAIWIIQNNTEVELTIAKKIISELERAWDVKISTQSSRVNLFTFSLYLNNGCVTYLKKSDCDWQFDRCKIHIQPLDFLRKKKINLQLTFDNVQARSRLTGKTPDIVEHIAGIFSGGPSSIPAAAKSICVNNLGMKILAEHSIDVQVKGYFLMQKVRHAKRDKLPSAWKGELCVNDAQFKVDDKVVAQQVSTRATFNQNRSTYLWSIQFNNFIKSLISTPTQTYTINGQWSDDKKNITIKNADSILDLNAEYFGDSVKISGSLPVDLVAKMATFFIGYELDYASNFSGLGHLDLRWMIADSRLDSASSVVIDNLKIKGLEFEKCSAVLNKSDGEKLSLNLDVAYNKNLQAHGFLKWDWSKSFGKIKLMNKLPINIFKDPTKKLGIGGYQVEENKLIIDAEFGKALSFSGIYNVSLSHSFESRSLKYSGSFDIKSDDLRINGKTRKGEYVTHIKFLPTPCVLECVYQVNGKKLLNLQCRDIESKVLHGCVDFLMIRSFLTQSTKHLFLGRDCSFNLSLDQSDLLNPHGTVKLATGSFYIPESRNLIQNFQTDFLINVPSRVELTNFKVGFFKGEIYSPKILIQLDGDNNLDSLHVPLQINDLLINWKRDLLAIIYGNILLKKTAQGNYKALANIVAKKSLLKENILSLPESASLSNPMGLSFLQNKDFEFDIRLSSEQPIKAKTPSLETNASINLRILYQKNKNIMRAPQLTGTVRLDSGHIKFLQHKLFFEYGKVQFISNQMNDPIIDLIARNRINRYQITLQATGSLQKPIIMLESNPELTDEQILGLLLSGSEQAKLQSDLFAILEQNLQDIILGNKTISARASGIFQKLAKPFKYIQITPDFTNQTARGGIKGTVSVNISDQVKAQIQKNFNLQDDFNAQVEYQLSDDINIKGILDQRGELGAEVELRLKL